jgi:hypothetical protein
VSSILQFVCLFGSLPFSTLGTISMLQRWFFRGGPEAEHRADGLFAIADLLLAAAFALMRLWPLAAFFALLGIVLAVNWWRKRKRRKRSPKAMGAKSRALLAALVRKAREAARPRPVLRPLPGGAQ